VFDPHIQHALLFVLLLKTRNIIVVRFKFLEANLRGEKGCILWAALWLATSLVSM